MLRVIAIRTAVCAGIVFSALNAAHASPIMVPTTPSIIANIVVLSLDPTNPIVDIRGDATVNVVELTTLESLGTAQLVGSTDPAPSNLMGLVGTSAEALLLAFDFSASVFDPSFPGPAWIDVLVGLPLTTVTDPALIGFVGIDVARFTLKDAQIVGGQIPLGVQFTYTLDFIGGTGDPVSAVPEPASMGLLGAGLLVAIRRVRRQNQA